MEARLADVIYTQLGLGGLILVVVVVAFARLQSELTKLRVEMAYQMNRDLLAKRFDAYGDLWSRMHPTAIYTAESFGPKQANEFREQLSTWYFSSKGGLFLTERARDFYFAMQDLLGAVGGLPEWSCDQRPSEPRSVFDDLLSEVSRQDRKLTFHVSRVRKPETLDKDGWREICRSVTSKLENRVAAKDPNAGKAILAAIQQVSSILRTNLVHELRSRLDVEWPSTDWAGDSTA